QFDPDRFGPEREEHKQPFAYLGFGAGMHQCMGQQFAFVQVRVLLLAAALFDVLALEMTTNTSAVSSTD
ncbi:unnamed protein product, partial [Laminaria digitata]